MKSTSGFNKLLLLSIVTLITIAFTACAQNVFFVRTLDLRFDKLDDNAPVKIYLKEKPNKENYDEIGMIAVRGSNIEMRFELARQKAREVGGDALIHLDEKNQQESQERLSTTYGHMQGKDGKIINFHTTTPKTETYSYIEDRFLVVRMRIGK